GSTRPSPALARIAGIGRRLSSTMTPTSTANSPRCWEPAPPPSAPDPASSPGSRTSTRHSPLSPPPRGRLRRIPADQLNRVTTRRCARPRDGNEDPVYIDKADIISVLRSRSEERRVGKEWRGDVATVHQTER